MFRASLNRWLRTPLLSGRLALLCGVGSVALPTFVRAGAHGAVTGCEFTPYLPFVLISAVLLGWWQATMVALGSVAVLGGLFIGSPDAFLEPSCFKSAAGIFLASSAVVVGVVTQARRMLAEILGDPDESSGGVIFSLDKGKVWASRHGHGPPVCLGSQGKVSTMMQDFLAQEELGKRLAGRSE